MKDREAWRAAIHGVAKSRTRLSDRTTTAGVPLLGGHHHKETLKSVLQLLGLSLVLESHHSRCVCFEFRNLSVL